MNDRKLGTDCACGGSAGTDSTGRMHYHCNGYKGPLDTYVCHCRCHTPDPYYQERKPADLGLQQDPKVKALIDAATDRTFRALTEAHTRLATGADPEATREALRRLADTGITAADVKHIPATLIRLFAPHQETTMHVADLNGTHLGKTITVTTKHETITGTLWSVRHEVAKISDDTLGVDPDDTPVYPGRLSHYLKVGAATAFLPGDADVEVHP